MSTSRDHKKATFRIADAAHRRRCGRCSTETEKTHFESRAGLARAVGDERGDLVLPARQLGPPLPLRPRHRAAEAPDHDAARGRSRRSRGSTRRRARCVSTAQGREKGQDPYFTHFYRIGLDGKGYVSLTPDDGDHAVADLAVGPLPRRHVLDVRHAAGRRRCATAHGKLVMPLEKADISKLLAAGWKPPMAFSVKAARRQDGHLRHAVPSDQLRSDEEVPDHQPRLSGAAVGQRRRRGRSPRRAAIGRRSPSSASSSCRSTAWGTPGRSKAFHDAYYGAMGRDNTLPDQVAGMKELAQRYPVDRHRPRGDLGPLGRRVHHGRRDVPVSRLLQGRHLRVGQPRSARLRGRLGRAVSGAAREERRRHRTATTSRRTRRCAKNLKGKLLLAHGMMDNNVPPYNTLLVVDALIKANKDFDLLLLPAPAHGFGATSHVHDAPALGLLRAVAARRRAAEGVQDGAARAARPQLTGRPRSRIADSCAVLAMSRDGSDACPREYPGETR